VAIGATTYTAWREETPMPSPPKLYVKIPRDDDGNDIADCWAYNSGGKTDDTDNSPGGANDGDGLSRYEEYRGLFIGGTHVRTNPNNKDLFIRDVDGIGTGYCNALGFELQLIQNDEWDSSTRKINFNGDNDQCALKLKNGGDSESNILGTCWLGTPNGGDEPTVYVTTITNGGGNQSHIDYVIAHECGHGVNITGDHDPAVGCIMDASLDLGSPPPTTSYCNTCLGQRQLH